MPAPERYPLMWVARLLPRTLRTRVFEPALYDLMSDDRTWYEDGVLRRARWRVKVVLLAADALRVGGLPLLWDSARHSRRLRLAAILVVLLLITLVLLRTNSAVDPDLYLPSSSP